MAAIITWSTSALGHHLVVLWGKGLVMGTLQFGSIKLTEERNVVRIINLKCNFMGKEFHGNNCHNKLIRSMVIIN